MPPSPLITAEWLHSKLNVENIKIFDCSYHLSGTERSAYTEYLTAHIEGAHFFDIDTVADTSQALPHMVPDLRSFLSAVQTYGIKDNDTVICYDNSPLRSSARVWWMFRYFGFNDVYILDGGQPAWEQAGLPLVTVKPTVKAPAKAKLYEPKEISELCKDRRKVKAASLSKTHQILDARSKGRFIATDPEPRPNLPSGHIPNSINLPFQNLFHSDGRYKEPDKLLMIFEQLGIDIDQPIITTCGSGITACTIAVALSLLGKWDTSIYDGAWIDWASYYSEADIDENMIRTGK